MRLKSNTNGALVGAARVWSAFFFMAGAILWACFFKVDVVVSAEGKLVTDTPNIVMKPLERTVIKSIDVKVGEVVKKDQVLFTFDPVMNNAEAERLLRRAFDAGRPGRAAAGGVQASPLHAGRSPERGPGLAEGDFRPAPEVLRGEDPLLRPEHQADSGLPELSEAESEKSDRPA